MITHCVVHIACRHVEGVHRVVVDPGRVAPSPPSLMYVSCILGEKRVLVHCQKRPLEHHILRGSITAARLADYYQGDYHDPGSVGREYYPQGQQVVVCQHVGVESTRSGTDLCQHCKRSYTQEDQPAETADQSDDVKGTACHVPRLSVYRFRNMSCTVAHVPKMQAQAAKD